MVALRRQLPGSGYRMREPVAILLSTAVIVPFCYFFWKSLTLRVGDTWPMFLWPAGFAATAVTESTRDGFAAEARDGTRGRGLVQARRRDGAGLCCTAKSRTVANCSCAAYT